MNCCKHAAVLDAGGIDVPKAMAGRSLLSLVERRAVDWPAEVLVQISESQTGRAIRTHRWKYSVRLVEKDGKGRWVSRNSAESYTDDALYDLYADPWELTNLIGMASFRHIVADLRTRLVRRTRAAGEAEPRFIDAPAVPALQRQPEYHEPSLGV